MCPNLQYQLKHFSLIDYARIPELLGYLVIRDIFLIMVDIPEEGYSRKASCALSKISTCSYMYFAYRLLSLLKQHSPQNNQTKFEK
jgi:hypothetical protein